MVLLKLAILVFFIVIGASFIVYLPLGEPS